MGPVVGQALEPSDGDEDATDGDGTVVTLVGGPGLDAAVGEARASAGSESDARSIEELRSELDRKDRKLAEQADRIA